jgi:hypothetical protein
MSRKYVISTIHYRHKPSDLFSLRVSEAKSRDECSEMTRSEISGRGIDFHLIFQSYYILTEKIWITFWKTRNI